MDLRALLRLLREHWLSIVLLTILGTLTAVLLVTRETPLYAAQATLYVSSRADPNNPVSAYQGSLLSQQQVTSYAQLIRSQRVLGAVAAAQGRPQASAQLAARTTAAVVPNTALLTVTTIDISAAGAAQTANAIAHKFVDILPSLEYSPDSQSPAVVVSVVSDATVPTTPVSPKPARSIGIGTMLGLLTGVASAAARRSLDVTVRTIQQAHESAGAPALGAVPVEPSASHSPLALHEATQFGRVEALRKISASLRFLDVERPHTVLLVTSPMPGEGKSSTACNLAITLARTGRKVMLIDGDLRRPNVANYLGLPAGAGLTSVLVGTASLTDATQYWADHLFAVLTSGPVPPNPSEMLGSQRLRDLLDHLRGGYDDVVMDAAPVLPVADTALAASACDGVILVARCGKTHRDQLQQAANTIRDAQVALLGVVLNRVPARGGATRYYYARHPGTYDDYRADQSMATEGIHR